MKKSVKVMLGVTVVAGVFGSGAYAGANNSWTNEVVSEASKEIGAAGYNKKEEIIGRDVDGEIKGLLNPEIDKQASELEKLLEEYYQMRLDGLSETPEFKEVEGKIADLKVSIFNRYKSDIDEMFEGR
jgi:hypothetical protein